MMETVPGTQCLLDVRNLKVVFEAGDGVATAVDDVSFQVQPGEIVAIVGESGSGKSVTAMSILRLIQSPGRITGGEIVFNGQDILKLDKRSLRRVRGNDISMIFQEPMTSLNPVLTIGDQIAEAIELHQRKSKAEAFRLAVEMLERVEIPSPAIKAKQYPHQLSGGQRQRVMIALALSCNPALLIADEPTTALDVIVQAQILNLVRKLKNETGASILFITHDLGVVAELADRVIVMQKGKIVEQGTKADIFLNPQSAYTRTLLEAVPRVDYAKPDGTLVRKAAPLIQIRNLCKTYGDGKFTVRAVNDLSLSIARGEVLALVGESGSGKSTAGRAALRLIEPSSGAIEFDGMDITRLSTRKFRSFRRNMQMIFQDPFASLSPRMTVKEIIGEALDIHKMTSSRRERDRRIWELLEMVHIDPARADSYPHEFSGGQRQRIGIARVLAVEPKFIVADECVSALDVSIRKEILDLLKDIRERLDIAFLFISHDLAVVQDIADSVAVMYRGELVEYSSTYEAYHNPRHRYTQALLDAVPSIEVRQLQRSS